MDCGFIQAVAPASQPVPLTNAAGSPDAFSETAAAFDAALSQTLATEGKAPAGAVPPSTGRGAQPAWLLGSLFTSTITTPPVAPEAAAEGELAVSQDGESTDEVTDGEAAGDLDAANLAVLVPVLVDVKPAAPAIVPALGGAAGTTPADVPVDNVTTKIAQQAAQAASKTGIAPGPAAAGKNTATAGETTAVVADAAVAATIVPESAVATGSADVTGAEGAREQTPVRGLTRSSSQGAFTPVQTSSEPTPQGVTAPVRPEVQPAPAEIAAVAAGNVAPAETKQTQQVESGAAIEIAVAAKGSANPDASMTGQDQQNGQSRPSQDFMRFTAALAQVSQATGEDAGRAPAVVHASATPAAAAPAAATPVAAAVPTPAPAETPGAENVGKLVQAMRVIARPGAWEANVRLNPEHLGEVNIAVRVERNSVSAVVNAEAAGVRQWLETQEQAVRNGMAEHGLQLDRFIVQRDGQRKDAEPEQQQEPRRQAPRRQAATTERFEIVV